MRISLIFCQAVVLLSFIATSASCADGTSIGDGDVQMLKLYKEIDGQLYYQEAWVADEGITYHYGKVGELGSTETVWAIARQGQSAVESVLEKALSDGYQEIPIEQLCTLVIQYRTDGWGNSDDLDRRHKVEDLLNESLGWSGVGHVDGGDIGSGTINIFALVVDADIAVKVIVDTLQENGVLNDSVIAVQGADAYDVLHPSDSDTNFSPL